MAATALQRSPAFPLRLRAVLGRWRAVPPTARQRPPVFPLRLRAVLGRWGAVPPTARQRPPAFPLPLRAVLGRWREVPPTARQRPPAFPLRLRAVLGRWREVPSTAPQRPPGRRRSPSRPTPGRSRAVAAMAPQQRFDRSLRFPEILDRWRVAAMSALQRQPPGRRRAPSGATPDRWAAVAAAALPSWPPDYRRPYRGFCTGGGRSLRRRCHGGLLTGRTDFSVKRL